MPYVDLTTGIRLRYDERGPRDGRPLVLAHGFGVSLGMWLPQHRALSERYRLITWDARGHGGSSAPESFDAYTMPLLAADLRGLLEALDAVDGAVIGGMSFGAMIALEYAVAHGLDVHALVCSDMTTRGTAPPGDDEGWARVPGLGGAMHAMLTRPDLTPLLPTVTMPTLVMVGEYDDLIVPGLPRLVDGLPRRRVVRLAGCVHGTSGQRPEAWNTAVLEFLADVAAGHPLGEDEMR